MFAWVLAAGVMTLEAEAGLRMTRVLMGENGQTSLGRVPACVGVCRVNGYASSSDAAFAFCNVCIML